MQKKNLAALCLQPGFLFALDQLRSCETSSCFFTISAIWNTMA